MNVELTEEQRLLQSTSRQFLDETLSLDALRHRSANDAALTRDFWIRAAALAGRRCLCPMTWTTLSPTHPCATSRSSLRRRDDHSNLVHFSNAMSSRMPW